VALDHLPPAFLALGRLTIAAAVLWPVVRTLEASVTAPGRHDAWRIAAMGAVGFAGAYACSHWGLARSTATNAALLIIVEPVSIMLLSPPLLGERLRRREAIGATVALVGVVLVVLNGVPGLTHALAPHWRGDLLLVLAGVAYGAYTLIGRDVLARTSPLVVTARSIAWGAVVMVPLAVAEWLAGARPAPSVGAVAGLLLPGGGDHRPGLSRVELGAGPGQRAPRVDLPDGAADRWRGARRGAPGRAAHRVHAGRRRPHRLGPLVDRRRRPVTVYSNRG
jgi:drug/metabolite transporter (DMT)-like permease